MGEALHIRGVVGADVVCETHDWTIERMRAELIPLMRARHGKGGVNVCVECIERWKAWADKARAEKNAAYAGGDQVLSRGLRSRARVDRVVEGQVVRHAAWSAILGVPACGARHGGAACGMG